MAIKEGIAALWTIVRGEHDGCGSHPLWPARRNLVLNEVIDEFINNRGLSIVETPGEPLHVASAMIAAFAASRGDQPPTPIHVGAESIQPAQI